MRALPTAVRLEIRSAPEGVVLLHLELADRIDVHIFALWLAAAKTHDIEWTLALVPPHLTERTPFV